MPKDIECHISHQTSRPSRGLKSKEYLGSWSLDMIAPITEGPLPNAGGLLISWDDVTIAELPKTVQIYAESHNGMTPPEILDSLLSPSAIAEACSDFVQTARNFISAECDERSAEIVLLRSGLLTETVPTLEQVGKSFNLTRERVRQIEQRCEGILTQPKHGSTKTQISSCPLGVVYPASHLRGIAGRFVRLVRRHSIAHAMRAWFDLNPGKPLTDSDLRLLTKQARQLRCCRRVLQILCYPYGDWNGDFWFKSEAARQACEALLDATDSWAGAKDWRHVAERMCLRAPGVEKVLDVEATLLRLGEAHDFGLGPNGKIAPQQSRLKKRIARKIVTYLIARAAPVAIHELADAISAGQVPFEVFLRPSVSPTWLYEYVVKSSELLIQLEDKGIALAPALAANKPTGVVGMLYSIVSRHGEPIRMQDLCDQASVYGIGRNQTGMLIHSHRAACLFMLTRGIVGLVGRDEDANPSDYEAANPWSDRKKVRPGHEIGLRRERRPCCRHTSSSLDPRTRSRFTVAIFSSLARWYFAHSV